MKWGGSVRHLFATVLSQDRSAVCGALQIRSWGSRGLQDCFFRSSRGARGLRNMRVSVVPRKLMLLIGKDTLKVFEARLGLENNIGCFPRAGHFQGKML